MSRSDQLVNDLAPNGVQFNTLGDVGVFIRGSGLQKSDLTDEGAPAIHYGQIHTFYKTWADKTKSFTDPALATRLRRAKPGDLIIATTSEDDAAVAKATAWIGEGEVAVSGDAYIYRHSLDPRYVAYFFQSNQFKSQKLRNITGTKVRRISGDALAKIRIPVPPIEVQRETVRTLDSFSDLQAELHTELEVELQARRMQYSHYRDALLVFSEPDVKWSSLGEVASVRTGQAPPADVLENGASYPFVNAGTTASGSTTQSNTPGDTVTIPSRGQGGVGIAGYQADEFWCGPLCYRIRSTEDGVLNRYLFHYFKSVQSEIRALQQTGGTPALNRKELVLVKVPIPTLDEQKRIVITLNKFDALVTELSAALPAENDARRKQYEHYRDQLLTFKELTA